LSWDKNGVEILVDDPKDLRKTDHIKALMTNQKIHFSVGFKEDIEKYIAHFFDPRTEVSDTVSYDNLDDIIPDVAFEEEDEVEEDIAGLDESSSQVVKFVDQVLVTAYRQSASDIHIEPSPVTRKTTIRYRIDGVCQEYIQVPNAMAPAIVSRLKIMADLDIAEKRRPQDGKIKLKRKGIPEFELRVSTMPTAEESLSGPMGWFFVSVPPAREKRQPCMPFWAMSTGPRLKSGRQRIRWKSLRLDYARCR
jgi:type II secretory ATPase GspE/PulE/Tfp pilus assembly ATPase PilB-like protein